MIVGTLQCGGYKEQFLNIKLILGRTFMRSRKGWNEVLREDSDQYQC